MEPVRHGEQGTGKLRHGDRDTREEEDLDMEKLKHCRIVDMVSWRPGYRNTEGGIYGVQGTGKPSREFPHCEG